MSGITVTTDGTDPRITFYVERRGHQRVRLDGPELVLGGTTNADSAAGPRRILLVSNDANWDVGNASTKSSARPSRWTIRAAPRSTSGRWSDGSPRADRQRHHRRTVRDADDHAGAIDGLKVKRHLQPCRRPSGPHPGARMTTLNVQDFGAVPQVSGGDQSAAINAALTQARLAADPAITTVFVPAGLWPIANVLLIGSIPGSCSTRPR
jgi:hypothetical protein